METSGLSADLIVRIRIERMLTQGEAGEQGAADPMAGFPHLFVSRGLLA